MKWLRDNPDIARQLINAARAKYPYTDLDPEDPKRVFGRGGYWGRMLGGFLGGLTGNSTIKSLATSAFDKAGDYIADAIPGGNLMASGAEALHRAVTGSGDYNMSDDMSMSMADISQSVPSFGGGSTDHVRIRSREYLGPVLGSAPLRIDNFLINPGDSVTFPKLSKLAQFYQQYIINGCIFYYKTTSGISTNSADTAIGQVHMAMNYDSGEPLYTTKQDLVGSQYSNSGMPSQDVAHGIECAAFTNGAEVKRIRHGDSGDAKADPLATDQGRFYLAVEGTNAAATRIGELWVTYDVTLIKSRDSKGGECASAHFLRLGNQTSTSLFNGAVAQYDTIGLSMTGNVITFPKYIEPGKYRIELWITPTASPPTGNHVIWKAPTITAVSGGSILCNNLENYPLQGDVVSWTIVPDAFNATYFINIDQGAGVSVVSVTFDSSIMIFGSPQSLMMRIWVSRVPDAIGHGLF